MRYTTRLMRPIALAAIALLALSSVTFAATRVVVTPDNMRGWHVEDQRTTGQYRFTNAYGDPDGVGRGSLELSTGVDNTAKIALYNNWVGGTRLSRVYALSYWTFQPAGNLPVAAASYQLEVDLNGRADGGETVLVYEPYWNGTVLPEVWQYWDVDAGRFWSSRTASDPANPACTVVAGAGGPPFYTLQQLQTSCPNAIVLEVGVNVGTYNPTYRVATDQVQFNSIIWDFEVGRRDDNDDDDDDDDDDGDDDDSDDSSGSDSGGSDSDDRRGARRRG